MQHMKVKVCLQITGYLPVFNGIRQLAPFILQKEMQPGEVKVKSEHKVDNVKGVEYCVNVRKSGFYRATLC